MSDTIQTHYVFPFLTLHFFSCNPLPFAKRNGEAAENHLAQQKLILAAMTQKEHLELMKKYNDSFAIVMNESKYGRVERHEAAVRAATLAEVMRDFERITNAIMVVQSLRS